MEAEPESNIQNLSNIYNILFICLTNRSIKWSITVGISFGSILHGQLQICNVLIIMFRNNIFRRKSGQFC